MDDNKYDVVPNANKFDQTFDRMDIKNILSWGFLLVSVMFALVAAGAGVDDAPWTELTAGDVALVGEGDYEFGLLKYTGCIEQLSEAELLEGDGEENEDCPTQKYSDDCNQLLKVCNPLDDCEGAGKGAVVLIVFGAVFCVVSVILAIAVQKWLAYIMANIGANLYFASSMLWWAGCHSEIEKAWDLDATLSTGWILCVFAFIFAFIAGALLCEWKPKHLEADPDIAELNEMHRNENQAAREFATHGADYHED